MLELRLYTLDLLKKNQIIDDKFEEEDTDDIFGIIQSNFKIQQVEERFYVLR